MFALDAPVCRVSLHKHKSHGKRSVGHNKVALPPRNRSMRAAMTCDAVQRGKCTSNLQEHYTTLKSVAHASVLRNIGCAATPCLTPSHSPSRCPRCYRVPRSSRPVILQRPTRGGMGATAGMVMPHPHTACQLQLQGLLLQVVPWVSGGPRYQRVLAGPRHCGLLASRLLAQSQSLLQHDCCWHCSGSSRGQEG